MPSVGAVFLTGRICHVLHDKDPNHRDRIEQPHLAARANASEAVRLRPQALQPGCFSVSLCWWPRGIDLDVGDSCLNRGTTIMSSTI